MTNRTRIFHESLWLLNAISGIWRFRIRNSKIAAEKTQTTGARRRSLEIPCLFSLGHKLCLMRGPGLSVNVKNQ